MSDKKNIELNFSVASTSRLMECPLYMYKWFFENSGLYSARPEIVTEQKPTKAEQEEWFLLLQTARANDLLASVYSLLGQGAMANGYRQMEAAAIEGPIFFAQVAGTKKEIVYAKGAASSSSLVSPLPPENSAIGKVVRGVPIVSDKSPLVEMAQSVCELAFAFVKITCTPSGSVKVSTNMSSNYAKGIQLCYGFSLDFIVDLAGVVERTIIALKGTMPEPFGTDSIKNARILMNRLMSPTISNVVKFAVAISSALYLEVTSEQRKSYFSTVPSEWAGKGVKAVIWSGSWALPKLSTNQLADFEGYTKYLLMLQEVRSKGDKYSDKCYRMPVGDVSVQLHLENAIRIYQTTGRTVVVTGEPNVLVKIAWAIHHHKIEGVKVNLVTQVGKMDVLNKYSMYPNNHIKFAYDLKAVVTPSNNKHIGTSQRWNEIVDFHMRHLSNFPVDTAVIIKSYYYPPLKGVKYITSAEPHNGSVLCLITGPVEVPKEAATWEASWTENPSFRATCMSATIYKTFFCLCREKVWDKMPLRPSFFTGPPMAMILDSMYFQEPDEVGGAYNDLPDDLALEDDDSSDDDQDGEEEREEEMWKSPLQPPAPKPKGSEETSRDVRLKDPFEGASKRGPPEQKKKRQEKDDSDEEDDQQDGDEKDDAPKDKKKRREKEDPTDSSGTDGAEETDAPNPPEKKRKRGKKAKKPKKGEDNDYEGLKPFS